MLNLLFSQQSYEALSILMNYIIITFIILFDLSDQWCQ